MSTRTFYCEHTAGESVNLRIYNSSGQVLDFNDGTFKAIGSAVTPYKAATERTGMSGTNRSGFTCDVDLADVNSSAVAAQFAVKWFDDTATTAVTITGVDDERLTVQLSEYGEQPVIGQALVSSTSTDGAGCHLSVWLMCGGQKVPLSGTVTCSIEVRRTGTGSGTDLFTVTQADKLGVTAVIDDRLELTVSDPGFSNDVQYALDGTVTVDGTVYNVHDAFISMS